MIGETHYGNLPCMSDECHLKERPHKQQLTLSLK